MGGDIWPTSDTLDAYSSPELLQFCNASPNTVLEDCLKLGLLLSLQYIVVSPLEHVYQLHLFHGARVLCRSYAREAGHLVKGHGLPTRDQGLGTGVP